MKICHIYGGGGGSETGSFFQHFYNNVQVSQHSHLEITDRKTGIVQRKKERKKKINIVNDIRHIS